MYCIGVVNLDMRKIINLQIPNIMLTVLGLFFQAYYLARNMFLMPPIQVWLLAS